MIAFAKPPGTSTPRTADELLAEFRNSGTQPAFEELVRRYAAMVFSECYAVTKSRHDAEDAAQATFLTLAVQARTGDEIRHLGPWLQRVARRVALDQQKAKRRRKKREDNHHRINGTTGEASPHRESMDQLELRHAMNEELQQLPAKYRMPLILHYFGGMTREQMAAELKCKPATLGVRLFRARDMLGKRLAKRGIALPAVALPMMIAMAVRESVENHGVMAMAASASQIAEAAVRLAAGQSVHHSGSSAAVIALAETASHQLVMRKVKSIIAAAAIGASALAAGGAEVVHKIANGAIQLPSIRSIFRDIGSRPFVPQFRVDASQTLEGGKPAPAGWPEAIAIKGPGRLERASVSRREEMISAPFTGGSAGQTSSPSRAAVASQTTSRAQASAEGAGRGENSNARPAAVANRSESSDAGIRPASSGGSSGESKPAVTASTDVPTYTGGGGGGGGTFGGANVAYALRPVPPISSRPVPGIGTGFGTVGSAGSSTTMDNVLRGNGKVAISGAFDNSGVVIADGYGQPATLDLTAASAVGNTVANPPTGVNGWYARSGGKLSLPPLALSAGTSTIMWGDEPTVTSPDLVNSARLTFHGVRTAGEVTISLLAADRPEVPAMPTGYQALTVWSLSEASEFDSLDVVARYLLPGSDLAGPASGLGLFYVDDAGRWVSAGAEIDVARRLISAEGVPATEMIALLTAIDQRALAARFDSNFAGEGVTTDDYLNSLLMQPGTDDTLSVTVPVGAGEPLLSIEGGARGIPEPSGCAAMLAGAVALLSRRRR